MPEQDALVERLGATQAPASEWAALLGGKGASLERLLRLGAPTPPGICLTTHAFRLQLAGTDGAQSIAELPDEAARAHLVKLLTDAPLASRLAAELDAAMSGLRSGPYAVRSSAVGEDSALASFAGIHDTELGLHAADVPDAIRRCWASLWSRRAVQYRASRGLPMEGAMAVVVQVMVPAEASAVVFTRHPVTGRADQVLVNAIRGLGEALVSGLETPDELVLDKASLTTLHLAPANGERVLSDSQATELGTLALQLEAEFGCAIDIEAALAGERWHILQARPITA